MTISVSDAIHARRAVRSFDPAQSLSEGEIERLLTLAGLSPSAFNLQHWRFVVVRDPALRAEIRKAAWDQAQITDAGALILLCADLDVWRSHARKVWEGAEPEVQDRMAGMIEQFYAGREWLQRDDAMRSLGMVAQTLMLAAQAMGYDSCPMDGFDPEAVARLVNLPDNHLVGLFVAIGKPQAESAGYPRPARLPLTELAVTDRFPA